MLDRILGFLALAALIFFMGVLMGFVPDVDLVLILAIVLAMAGYDFWRSLFKRRNGNGSR